MFASALAYLVVQFVGAFLEKAEEAFFFLLVEVFELSDDAGKHLADLAQILGAHIFQRALGKVCHLLLCTGAVLQHDGGIGQVDLICKVVDHLALFLGELALIKYRLRLWLWCHLLLHRCFHGRCRLCKRVEGQRRLQILGCRVDVIHKLVLLLSNLSSMYYFRSNSEPVSPSCLSIVSSTEMSELTSSISSVNRRSSRFSKA